MPATCQMSGARLQLEVPPRPRTCPSRARRLQVAGSPIYDIACHGESVRYNRGTQLHPYTCKMSEHPPDRRPGRFLGHATARHRIGQPVLLFAKVQKSKLVKNNFIVYFSSICLYFISGCAGDTGLYAPKMSEHLPDLRPSRFFGRTCARHRIGQPVLLFAKVQQKNR